MLPTLAALGQYPFEKYPAVKYQEYKKWKVYDRIEAEGKIHYTLTALNFFRDSSSITIQLTGFFQNRDTGPDDSSFIRIFKGKNQMQKFKENYELGGILDKPQSLFVEDINGDELKDIKILIPYWACGAYNYPATIIYLFQKPDGTFTKISFFDTMMESATMMEYENRVERDIDGDGNYEIITKAFLGFGEHNYWLFNLYNFVGDSLTNVNYKDNYPIMVQLLYRGNYAITDKISRNKMKEFEMKLPNEYDKK